MSKAEKFDCSVALVSQGHFRAVAPCTSVMVIYINFVLNNFSAASLVQVSGERLQDQWSSGSHYKYFF